MSDIFQSGDITTLHRLGEGGVARLERELCDGGKAPIALVLPCHVRDLATLAKIAAALRRVRYLHQVFIGLDGARRRADFLKARGIFSGFAAAPLVVWNDGPRMRNLHRTLADAGIGIGSGGKGRNVWLAIGGVLAFGQAKVIAVHDCDILNYDRELLARLCHPVALGSPGFEFCKGYYARFDRRLHGRVARLLVAPLLRAFRATLGEHPLLTFLGTFRYPLAGEFAVHTGLARGVPMRGDWAFEIGLLAEVFRHANPAAICQSELCANYDHKHQRLSPGNPDGGLHRMAMDIACALFDQLATAGVKLDAALHRIIQREYASHAADLLRRYEADAAINGLEFRRATEQSAVAVFTRALRAARRGSAVPVIPDWDSVQRTLPDFLSGLRAAILADNTITSE